MNNIIRTLALILSLTNFLQFIALLFQYRANKTVNGSGWWMLGSASLALGYAFNSMRDNPTFGLIAIVANNALFVSGMTCLYVGVLRFLGQRERRGWLIGFCVAMALLAYYFTYHNNDLAVRRVILSVALASLSFLIAWALFVRRTSLVAFTAHALSMVFLANGFYFTMRMLTTLAGAPVGDIFSDSLSQVSSYLIPFITSTLWTFGLIIMANQHLSAKSIEDRESLERIFDTSPDAALIIRQIDGCFVRVNDGFSTLTGFTRAEVIGKSILDVRIWQDPADRQRFATTLNEIGSCENLEAVFQRKDGSQFIGIVSAKIIILQDTPHIISMTRDITERKRIEESLKQSALQNFSILKTTLDGFWLTDPNTQRLIDVNDAYCRMSGYSREELLQMTIAQLEVAERFDDVNAHMERVKNQKADRFESIHCRKDGSTFPVDIYVQYLDETGKIFAFLRDITDRKQVEEALRESEEKFRLSFMTGLDAIYIGTLEEGLIIEANKQFEDVFGYTRAETIGKTSFQLNLYYDPDDRARMVSELKTKSCVKDLELKGRKKGGEIITISLSVSIMLIDNKLHILGVIRDITERKQAELYLRETFAEAQRFRNALDQVSAHIYMKDTQSRYIFANQATLELFGCSAEELIGCEDTCFFPPDTVKQLREVDLRVFAGERTTEEIDIADGKAGRRVYWEIKTPIYAEPERKTILGLLGVSTDITERKLAEEALRESENRFHSLYDNATIGIYRTTPDGRILLLNPAGVHMLGYDTFEEIAKRNLEEEGSFDAGYERIQFHEEMKREGTIIGLESIWKRKDGSKIYIRESTTAVKDGNGTIMYYDGTFEDITERKQAETALRTAEENYRSIFENATVGIFQSSPEGYFYNVNPSMARIFGYSNPHEMVESIKDISSQIYVNVDERKLFKKLFLENDFIENFEGYNRRKDKSIIWTSTNARCIRDANGNALYYEGFLQDITERKWAENEIRQLNTELEQRVEERTKELLEAHEQIVRHEKLALLGQMASSIGHELRNPLAVITSAVYYLKLIQPDADDMIKKYHSIIGEEVRTSEKIITDLLDFARIKSVDREVVSISELIRQTLERFPAPASVEVTHEIPIDLPQVFVDLRQMTQVLGNLIINAYQAMVSITGAPKERHLRLSSNVQNDMINIIVEDTGVGIQPENMSKLFEPLFTTKAKGIGLGLAVSKKLIEANGGHIEVLSEAGVGSIFTIWLPVHSVTTRNESVSQ